jgi:hypothetical protein
MLVGVGVQDWQPSRDVFAGRAWELTEIAERFLCGVAAGLRMWPARCDQGRAGLDFGVVGQLFRTAGVAASEGMPMAGQVLLRWKVVLDAG